MSNNVIWVVPSTPEGTDLLLQITPEGTDLLLQLKGHIYIRMSTLTCLIIVVALYGTFGTWFHFMEPFCSTLWNFLYYYNLHFQYHTIISDQNERTLCATEELGRGINGLFQVLSLSTQVYTGVRDSHGFLCIASFASWALSTVDN